MKRFLRFGKKARLLVIGVVAALTVAGVSAATVTFVPGGPGFVGKGDVQVAFHWNNAQFQANAPDITFTEAFDLIQAEYCTHWQNGEIVESWVRSRTLDEDKVETYTTRVRNGKISGFDLTGPDESTDSFHYDPWQGDALPSECFSDGSYVNTVDSEGNGWNSWTIIDPLHTSSLYVNYGGQRVKLATYSR
jgi:hypothetical protein